MTADTERAATDFAGYAFTPAETAPARPGLFILTRAVAGREGFAYLDFAPVLGAPDGGMRADLSRDGTHPNAQGYALMEPLILAAMRQAQGGQ